VIAIPAWALLATVAAVPLFGEPPDSAHLRFSAGVLSTGAVVVMACCCAVAALGHPRRWVATGGVLAVGLGSLAARFATAAAAAGPDGGGSSAMTGYGEGVLWALAAPTSWPLLGTGVVSAVLAVRRVRASRG
jgi:hypothetical protein